jgi:hypothetical protein
MNLTHLSFTRLKNLAHSPRALWLYMEGSTKPTKAMEEGRLLDVLLFTPDLFEEQFYLMPATAKKPTAAQINAKKPSEETLEQIERWREIEKESAGKTIITEDQLEEAHALEYAIRYNRTVMHHGLLDSDNFDFQFPVNFTYKGYEHRGFKDAEGRDNKGNGVIWDLKRMGSKSGESQVRWAIRDNMYDLQAAIYCHHADTIGIKVKYYIIAVDNNGFVTPFEITREARDVARGTWDYLIDSLQKLERMDHIPGVEFWANKDGFFSY